MKKALMALVTVMLLMGLATGASAAVSDPLNLSVNTVSFYLVDWDPTQFNNQVVMTASTLGAPIGNLQYSFNDSSWVSFSGTGTSGSVTIPISSATHTQLMYLRYVTDQSADMLFQSGTMPNTKVALTNGTDTAFGSPPNLNVEGHPEKVLDFFDHG